MAAPDQERKRQADALYVLQPDDWMDAPEAVPRAGSTVTISLRMPAQMLAVLKALAGREGIGYQVMIKRWLDERIRAEREKVRGP